MSKLSDVAVLESVALAAFTVAMGKQTGKLTKNFQMSDAMKASPEDQLKPFVSTLIEEAGRLLGLDVVTRTEVRVDGLGGRPDLGVIDSGLPVGNVELKQPGLGANPNKYTGDSKKQWNVFKALPNMVYTDGREWALYRSGKLVGDRISLSFNPVSADPGDVSGADAAQLLTLLSEFLRWEPVVPSTPRALADMLAPVTRVLRDEVLANVSRDDSAMHSLAGEWRNALFPDASDAQFADGYAQTFTYALLLARLEGATSPLTAETAATELAADHTLLSQALKVLGQPEAREEIGMPVGLLERLIGAVDAAKLSKHKDPWLYFYEDFLAAYDPVQRNNRGVYYTPIEIVECQVRLAEHLLSTRLDRPNGYAGSSTEGDVIVLDPAAGTGTYPLAVVASVKKSSELMDGPGGVPEAVTRLSHNLNAFELLVGPYAVAHLRLSRSLVDAGALLPSHGVNVFLTDTLSAPVPEHHSQQVDLFQKALAKEQERASVVKSPKTRVTVVIGNPPYDRDNSGEEAKKGGMIRFAPGGGGYGLITDFQDPLPASVHSQHGMNLFNDYVYFWRWAIWKVCEQHNDPGIVSFITPSAYLDGPGFAGMREVMRRNFDEIWLIDLGGDGRGPRKDPNVFVGVQTPVVIALAVRTTNKSETTATPATVRYRRIRGTRLEKLEQVQKLLELDPNDPNWRMLPNQWQSSFVPTSGSAYSSWTRLMDVFPWTPRGIQFSRTWPVAPDKATLQTRWNALLNAGSSADREAMLSPSGSVGIDRSHSSFLTPGVRLPSLASLMLGDQPDGVERIAFRSFDRRWCIADKRVIERPRPPLWEVGGTQQVYLTSILGGVTSGPAVVANTHVPDLNAFNNRGGLCMPLFRNSDATALNISTGLVEALTSAFGEPVDPIDVAAYVFGLLGTGAFSDRFDKVIATDGLRIPWTADRDLFAEVAEFGRELLWRMTYGERMQPLDNSGHPITKVPVGSAKSTTAVPGKAHLYPESFSYDEATQTLSVGAGTFAPVSPEVWDFQVSGLSVVRSWLTARIGADPGKVKSELERIRPTGWTFTTELVQILAAIEYVLDATPTAASLIDRVVGGPLIDPTVIPAALPDEDGPLSPAETDESQLTMFDTSKG